MKRQSFLIIVTGFWLLLVMIPVHAQSANGQEPVAVKNEELSAERLYQDANRYLDLRYEEFNKKNLPYDPQLEAKTRQEQRDLAIKNATTLQNRKSLKPEDMEHLPRTCKAECNWRRVN